jgi:hypothetical protein
MKGIIVAFVLLGVVFTLVAINTVILHRNLDAIIEEVSAIDTKSEKASADFKACYSQFERYERFISLTVSHSDLTDIDDAFTEIIAASEIGDTETMSITKSRLLGSLKHLRRLSGINIDSILSVSTHILSICYLS